MKENTHEQMRRQVHSRPLTQLMRETFSDRLDRGLRGVVRRSAATVLRGSRKHAGSKI